MQINQLPPEILQNTDLVKSKRYEYMLACNELFHQHLNREWKSRAVTFLTRNPDYVNALLVKCQRYVFGDIGNRQAFIDECNAISLPAKAGSKGITEHLKSVIRLNVEDMAFDALKKVFPQKDFPQLYQNRGNGRG